MLFLVQKFTFRNSLLAEALDFQVFLVQTSNFALIESKIKKKMPSVLTNQHSMPSMLCVN